MPDHRLREATRQRREPPREQRGVHRDHQRPHRLRSRGEPDHGPVFGLGHRARGADAEQDWLVARGGRRAGVGADVGGVAAVVAERVLAGDDDQERGHPRARITSRTTYSISASVSAAPDGR